jgi:hypothetical protein
MAGEMAAPTDVNNDNNSEILNTSSQPNVSITRSSNKRSNPDSPDSLPATQKQNLRQIRILDICNTLPGVNLTINDTGRSYVIRRAKSGKCQVKSAFCHTAPEI